MIFHWLTEVALVIGFFAQTQALGAVPANVPGKKDVYYTGGFAEDVVECPDYENEFMISKLTVATSEKDPSTLVLRGTIDLTDNITPMHMVKVVVCKVTVAGCELMYTAMGNVCETLTDVTAPWYPLLAAFKRQECDILKGLYTVDDLEVTLDYAKDVMTHEFVGEYGAKVSLMLNGEQLSCYDMIVSVEEKQE